MVTASHGGHDTHPAWYLNLQADRECAGAATASATCRCTRGTPTTTERAVEYPRFVEMLSTYAEYQEATDRRIPVVFLDPV